MYKERIRYTKMNHIINNNHLNNSSNAAFRKVRGLYPLASFFSYMDMMQGYTLACIREQTLSPLSFNIFHYCGSEPPNERHTEQIHEGLDSGIIPENLQ